MKGWEDVRVLPLGLCWCGIDGVTQVASNYTINMKGM